MKDANERADKYMNDVKVVRDAKVKGDTQMKELQAMMDTNSPKIIKNLFFLALLSFTTYSFLYSIWYIFSD